MQKNLKKRRDLFICNSCGHIDFPKVKKAGSYSVELTLWLFFLVPGLVYNSWRNANKHLVCSSCGNQEVIELDTPRGKKLASEIHSFKEGAPILEQIDQTLKVKADRITAQKETVSMVSNSIAERLCDAIAIVLFLAATIFLSRGEGLSKTTSFVLLLVSIVGFTPSYLWLSKALRFNLKSSIRLSIVIVIPVLTLLF